MAARASTEIERALEPGMKGEHATSELVTKTRAELSEALGRMTGCGSWEHRRVVLASYRCVGVRVEVDSTYEERTLRERVAARINTAARSALVGVGQSSLLAPLLAEIELVGSADPGGHGVGAELPQAMNTATSAANEFLP